MAFLFQRATDTFPLKIGWFFFFFEACFASCEFVAFITNLSHAVFFILDTAQIKINLYENIVSSRLNLSLEIYCFLF